MEFLCSLFPFYGDFVEFPQKQLFRMMLVGSFITAIRNILIYIGDNGGDNPVPMIASIVVFILINVLYNRAGMRIGTTF